MSPFEIFNCFLCTITIDEEKIQNTTSAGCVTLVTALEMFREVPDTQKTSNMWDQRLM